MFEVGDKVIVKKVNKSDPPLAECEEADVRAGKQEDCRQLVGRPGRVKKVDKGTGGVGDSPDDPFYLVGFRDGRQDGFWGEELRMRRRRGK
jgi:hypothetical protein